MRDIVQTGHKTSVRLKQQRLSLPILKFCEQDHTVSLSCTQEKHLALNLAFVKFVQVAAGISSLFLPIAVQYLQIHNLSFVNGYFGGFQFFVTTGKAAINTYILACWSAHVRVSLGHIHTQEYS